MIPGNRSFLTLKDEELSYETFPTYLQLKSSWSPCFHRCLCLLIMFIALKMPSARSTQHPKKTMQMHWAGGCQTDSERDPLTPLFIQNSRAHPGEPRNGPRGSPNAEASAAAGLNGRQGLLDQARANLWRHLSRWPWSFLVPFRSEFGMNQCVMDIWKKGHITRNGDMSTSSFFHSRQCLGSTDCRAEDHGLLQLACYPNLVGLAPWTIQVSTRPCFSRKVGSSSKRPCLVSMPGVQLLRQHCKIDCT